MFSIDGGKDRKKKIEIAKAISFPPPPPMQAGAEFGTICCGRQGRKEGSRLPKNCIPKTAFAGCTRKKSLYYEEKEHQIRRRFTALKHSLSLLQTKMALGINTIFLKDVR